MHTGFPTHLGLELLVVGCRVTVTSKNSPGSKNSCGYSGFLCPQNVVKGFAHCTGTRILSCRQKTLVLRFTTAAYCFLQTVLFSFCKQKFNFKLLTIQNRENLKDTKLELSVSSFKRISAQLCEIDAGLEIEMIETMRHD